MTVLKDHQSHAPIFSLSSENVLFLAIWFESTFGSFWVQSGYRNCVWSDLNEEYKELLKSYKSSYRNKKVMCTIIYVFYILKVVDIVTTVLPADLHKKSHVKKQKNTPHSREQLLRGLRQNKPSGPLFSSVSFNMTFIC